MSVIESRSAKSDNTERPGISGRVRLSIQAIEQIRETIRTVFSERAKIVLFGSRTQVEARGGDLDILVIADATRDVLARARIRAIALLQIALGEQHIDFVVTSNPDEDDRLIVREALRTGVLL